MNNSCLRGLQRFELGQDFNLWVFKFYNEIVEKNLQQYFPYDTDSTKLEDRIIKRKLKTANATEDKITEIIEDGEDNMVLARNYLSRCLSPQSTRCISTITKSDDVGDLWSALLTKCREKNTKSLREVYQQATNIKMSSK